MTTFALVVALTAAAPAPPAIVITSPNGSSPVFGAVQFSVTIKPFPAGGRVRFLVDGAAVAEKDHPPFSLVTMLPDENAVHSFRVELVSGSTVIAAAERRTPAYVANEKVNVELRQLYVRVTKQRREGGELVEEEVTNLPRDSFTIADEGEAQTIRTFASGDTPLAALVLVDASDSMAGERVRAALGGARAFFEAMAPLDEGRVIAFSDRVLLASPFTSLRDVLLAGLDGVRARGGTAINDHLYLALREVDQRQGRRVVILLSDGIDSDSVLPMHDVRQTARSSQAVIYWIRIEDAGAQPESAADLYSTWRDGAAHRREFQELVETATESGGRIVPVHSLAEIEPAFAAILHELRAQYVLGYFPSACRHDGSWHRVLVTVKDASGCRVHTRDGYLDF
jgi:Ca-activated chloride channel family protein